MTKVRINRAELWGNHKDGLDCNNIHPIAEFETDLDLESTELCPKVILKIAREHFGGYSFPLNENNSNFIGKNSKCISVEWRDNFEDTVIYEVFYRGQFIGEIVITEETDTMTNMIKAHNEIYPLTDA